LSECAADDGAEDCANSPHEAGRADVHRAFLDGCCDG
jgi:hypothetical protein